MADEKKKLDEPMENFRFPFENYSPIVLTVERAAESLWMSGLFYLATFLETWGGGGEEGCGWEVEESKFFSCLNFRTWGEVSEMVTGISEVNEGRRGGKWRVSGDIGGNGLP